MPIRVEMIFSRSGGDRDGHSMANGVLISTLPGAKDLQTALPRWGASSGCFLGPRWSVIYIKFRKWINHLELQDSEDSAESAKSRESATPMGKETVHELLHFAEEHQLPRLRHRCEAPLGWSRRFFSWGEIVNKPTYIYIYTYIHTYTNIVNIAKKCAYEELQWSSLFIVAMKTGTLPPGILNVGTDEMLTNPDCINFSA